ARSTVSRADRLDRTVGTRPVPRNCGAGLVVVVLRLARAPPSHVGARPHRRRRALPRRRAPSRSAAPPQAEHTSGSHLLPECVYPRHEPASEIAPSALVDLFFGIVSDLVATVFSIELRGEVDPGGEPVGMKGGAGKWHQFRDRVLRCGR